MADFLAFAAELADAARAETLERFARGCAAEDKSGGAAYDPVTEADREAELAIRRLIERTFPDHGISGEEFPDRPARGRHCWSIDPVDGTRAFVCGLPSWTTLIALLEDGMPRVGVIDAPAMGERYLGCGDTGLIRSRSGEAVLRTSRCASLAQARLSTTDPYLFAGAEYDAFSRVRACARTTRYGLDAYGYARLAAGTLDLVIESGLKPHDYNALIPVVRAAGGTIGDWSGGEDFGRGMLVAAATPDLYAEAVDTLAL